MVCLWIRAFLSGDDLFGKKIPEGVTEQPFFLPMVVLVAPWNGVEVFHNAPVTEGNPHLKAGPHTHPVLPVQQGLHKPPEV